MSEQLGFEGFGEATPTDRLFFAVFPPRDVQERIAVMAQDLRSDLGFRGRPHLVDRFHVTLFHIGDYAGVPADLVARATEAAETVALPSFEVVFDRAVSFSSQPRNRPFTLQGGEGVADLKAMRERLGLALAGVGLGKLARTVFTPHVTLLYDDRAAPEQPVPPIGWTVEDFVLVHSLLGKTQHIHLKRWPLRN